MAIHWLIIRDRKLYSPLYSCTSKLGRRKVEQECSMTPLLHRPWRISKQPHNSSKYTRTNIHSRVLKVMLMEDEHWILVFDSNKSSWPPKPSNSILIHLPNPNAESSNCLSPPLSLISFFPLISHPIASSKMTTPSTHESLNTRIHVIPSATQGPTPSTS